VNHLVSVERVRDKSMGPAISIFAVSRFQQYSLSPHRDVLKIHLGLALPSGTLTRGQQRVRIAE
jgi:hypothetical protein